MDNVTRHQVLGLDSGCFTVTGDKRFARNKILKVFHQRGGLRSLRVREAASNENDCCQHDAQIEVGLIDFVLLNSVANETECRATPEQQREETGHFLQENAVPRDDCFFG
jgi:hypothetical protein